MYSELFKLQSLPYVQDALEPVISARTLSFHHGKHLQGYVDNLNKLVAGTPFEGKTLEEIVRTSEGAIFNNAGQILNHNLYFEQFCAGGSALTDSQLKAQIESQWKSLDAFQEAFVAKGVSLFGSGWVWLSSAADGTLEITQEPNAGNPLTRGFTPLLTFDVWEHAYYLDYQNRRAVYLSSLWQILNWSKITTRYKNQGSSIK